MANDKRLIINKRGEVWEIPDGAQGVPIEQAWPDTQIPDSLKGALVYQIDGQEVIAFQ